MANTIQIAINAHYRIIRSSFFLLLLLVLSTTIFFSSYMTLFEFGKDLNLIREIAWSTIFVWTLLTALLGTSLVITEELENRVLHTILSKPVTIPSFLAGKLLGVTSAIFLGIVLLSSVMFYTIWVKQGKPLVSLYEIGSSETFWRYMNRVFFYKEVLFLAQTAIMSTATAFIISSLSLFFFTLLPQGSAFIATIFASVISQSIHLILPSGFFIPTLIVFQLPTIASEGQLISGGFIAYSVVYLASFIIFIVTLNTIIFERKNI